MARPRPVPFFLVVKKGSNMPRQMFRRDARPGVLEGDLQAGPPAGENFRAHRQLAVAADGLDAVEHEVHERLLQLRFVAAHRVGAGTVIAFQHDHPSADLVFQQPQRMVEQLVDAHRGRRRRLRRDSRSICVARPSIRFNSRRTTSAISLVLALFQQHLNVGLDGHQAVLDFVREAGGDEAKVGQPVEPAEIFLQISWRRRQELPPCRRVFFLDGLDDILFHGATTPRQGTIRKITGFTLIHTCRARTIKIPAGRIHEGGDFSGARRLGCPADENQI